MKIRRILNPVAQENTYILENDTACLVIDPGSDTSAILAELKASDKPVAAILLTHTHYDHIMSVEAVRQAYNHPPVYVAEAEKDWLLNPIDNLSGLPLMTIWKTLLSIQQNTTSISLRTITSRISSLKLFQPQDTLLEVLLLSLIKKKLYFLVMPSLKKQLDAGTFQQETTNNYLLVLKSNSLHFLTTTKSSQGMDGTPLLVMRRSLTHIFHKKTKACRHLL